MRPARIQSRSRSPRTPRCSNATPASNSARSAADTAGKLATIIGAARLVSAPCGALENLLHRTIADANDAAAQLIGVDVPAPE